MSATYNEEQRNDKANIAHIVVALGAAYPLLSEVHLSVAGAVLQVYPYL